MDKLQIKKTVGHPKLDHYINGKLRKGYAIHTECGQVFKAEPLGTQRYKCEGIAFKSLRAVKDSILKGALGEESSELVEPSEASTLSGPDAWDCVHPCALLAHLYDLGILGELGYKHKGIKEAYTETLDNYGWLDCMGRPDIARAEREIARVKKFKEN